MATKKTAAGQAARESKRDRFVRLAERRTTTALQTIRLIGNLANRNNYEYADADARKILGALSQELDNLKRKFSDTPGREATEFRL